MNKINDLGLFLQVEHCGTIGNKACDALTSVNKSCCIIIFIRYYHQKGHEKTSNKKAPTVVGASR